MYVVSVWRVQRKKKVVLERNMSPVNFLFLGGVTNGRRPKFMWTQLNRIGLQPIINKTSDATMSNTFSFNRQHACSREELCLCTNNICEPSVKYCLGSGINSLFYTCCRTSQESFSMGGEQDLIYTANDIWAPEIHLVPRLIFPYCMEQNSNVTFLASY